MQRSIVEPILPQAAESKILDQNIALSSQIAHKPLPFSTREINGYRPLVAVGAKKICRLGSRLPITAGNGLSSMIWRHARS